MTTISTEEFGRVAVLMGGESSERQISLNTGSNVLTALLEKGIDAVGIDVQADIATRLAEEGIDRAFIALHGPGGEDGVIQGMLEMLKIPYTGSGVAASALTLNKAFTKWVWASNRIPTLDFVYLDNDTKLDDIIARLGLPLCVKPVDEGSSFGVSRVDKAEDLQKAISHAQQYNSKIIIEPWVIGRELTVGILNDRVLPIIEVRSTRGYYDFESKYQVGYTEYLCPADISKSLEAEIGRICLKAFHITGCQSWGRIDLMLDKDNHPWLLEVNTVPGMTNTSLVPKAAKQLGISFADCVVNILQGSFRHQFN